MPDRPLRDVAREAFRDRVAHHPADHWPLGRIFCASCGYEVTGAIVCTHCGTPNPTGH